MAKIGVLALQGAFAAHVRVLEELGHRVIEVRSADALSELDGLVLPGGESTTMLKLIDALGMEKPLRALIAGGKPVLATCAGLILLASEVRDPEQKSFGAIDATVARNAWGSQVESFEAEADGSEPRDARSSSGGLEAPRAAASPLRMIFIRAPRIVRVGPRVSVLARYQGEPVLIRQGGITAATFHPELSGDPGIHASVFES